MTKRIGVVAVFLVGCAVGGVSSQLVVPKASAQQAATLHQWEYMCRADIAIEEMQAFANRAGGQGWELATSTIGGGMAYPCFKRPKL